MQRILEAHANVRDYNCIEAKLSFIRAWQALPEFGVSLFVVKFVSSKKEVIVAQSFNSVISNQGY